MRPPIKLVIDHLYEKSGLDFSGYHSNLIEGRILNRLNLLRLNTIELYLSYLQENSAELDILCDSLTVNVSEFFRNPITYDYLSDVLLPSIISRKSAQGQNSIRIWSAGCATGEEPYSVAIILDTIQKKINTKLNISIIATDIDNKSLIKAKEGVYSASCLRNIRYKYVDDYFIKDNNQFYVKEEIKKMVSFSFYDLLDQHTYSPPDSMFGEFDIILCRNVLIYFQENFQNVIYEKLAKSLIVNGYLVLGETESMPEKFSGTFNELPYFLNIYHKVTQYRRPANV